jgi:hypothetical protein
VRAAVYEGIDFSPQAMKSIADIAKATGNTTSSVGNYIANSNPSSNSILN